jgi:hypothetical protein
LYTKKRSVSQDRLGTNIGNVEKREVFKLSAGVFTMYTLGWLRQEENLYVDVPPEMASGYPEAVREILGCAHKTLSPHSP